MSRPLADLAELGRVLDTCCSVGAHSVVLATQGSRDIHRAALRVRGEQMQTLLRSQGGVGRSGLWREPGAVAPGKVTNRDRGRLEGGMLLKGAGW